MSANDERTEQNINTHKNQLRNQEKDSPERAKPKAKNEPKPNPILKITEPPETVTPPVNDAPKQTNVTIVYRKA